MLYQRIGGVFGLITMLCFGLWRFFPPQPLIVVWLTVVCGVLTVVFLLIAAIVRRREARPR
jgi:hypothetical protein